MKFKELLEVQNKENKSEEMKLAEIMLSLDKDTIKYIKIVKKALSKQFLEDELDSKHIRFVIDKLLDANLK